MTQSNFKNPPSLESSPSFDSWENELKLWVLVTDLKKEKQGPAVVLSLSGKAREAALEIPSSELVKDDGVPKIVSRLASIYRKDTVDTAYEAFENFISFKREPSMKINDYITEFEGRYSKAKNQGFELSSSSLAYFLLNQAQLTEDDRKLVRATLAKLDLDDMKEKLKKVFGSSSRENSMANIGVKIEDVNITDEADILYGRFFNPRSTEKRSFPGHPFKRDSETPANDYGNSRISRGNVGNYNRVKGGKNAFDKKGNRLRCLICESIYHFANSCPEKTYFCESSEGDNQEYDIILYQSNLLTEDQYKNFVAESCVSAILDSGASATVAGKVWFENYVEGLSDAQRDLVEYYNSDSAFKFGSGEKFQSLFRARVPAKIGYKDVFIITDVIESTVPLLLSKEAMKKANTEINFKDDTVRMFNQKQDVVLTKSGHYAVPLNLSRKILLSVNSSENVKICLFASSDDPFKTAKKLHAQFGHPPKSKLFKLMKRAGKDKDDKLMNAIAEISDSCSICKEFKRPGPTPVVGLPHCTYFNEMVAMDLKSFDGKIILHLIDHLTRFSAATRLRSKEPEEVIDAIFKIWISIFGAPKKFLADNGGEFANAKFLEMAESLNIRVMHTAGESPWSNGLVERHNMTMAEILQKVLAENLVNFDTALCWAINAKNSLANVLGFSPSQLALGCNPQLPNFLDDNIPAMEPRRSEDIIAENLNALKLARRAFIETEASERLKRAIKHNIRPSANNKFSIGDQVIYKRNDSKKWKGLGKVIGYESSNILIKHGAHYVRVHACRVMLDKKGPGFTPSTEVQESTVDLSGTNDDKAEKSTSDDSDLETSQETSCNSVIPAERETNSEKEASQEINVGLPILTMKKGMQVRYRTSDGKMNEAVVVRRTGKATGKFKDCWCFQDKSTGQLHDFNIVDDLDYIEEIEPNDDVESDEKEIFTSPLLVHKESFDLIKAKKAELMKWLEENVYSEMHDKGQETLSR